MQNTDLNSMSIAELDEFIHSAQSARSKKVEARRAELLAELAALDGEAIVPTRPKKKMRAKYQDDKGNTWTGAGRVPRWIAEYEAEGRGRHEFETK